MESRLEKRGQRRFCLIVIIDFGSCLSWWVVFRPHSTTSSLCVLSIGHRVVSDRRGRRKKRRRKDREKEWALDLYDAGPEWTAAKWAFVEKRSERRGRKKKGIFEEKTLPFSPLSLQHARTNTGGQQQTLACAHTFSPWWRWTTASAEQ